MITLKDILKNPILIKNVSSPSEEMQMAAIVVSPFIIEFIDNPTIKVQKIAVSKDALCITGIKNPSEKLKLCAIIKNPGIIFYLPEHSELLQLMAVRKEAFCLYLIPPERIFKSSITKNRKQIIDHLLGYIQDNDPTKYANVLQVLIRHKINWPEITAIMQSVDPIEIEGIEYDTN